jgi:hypothetical protein
VLLSRALSNGHNVYLKINTVCYVFKKKSSVDLNGSETSTNKEMFKVAKKIIILSISSYIY